MEIFKTIIEMLIKELNEKIGDCGEYSIENDLVRFFDNEGGGEPACQLNADGVRFLAYNLERKIKGETIS